MDTSSALMASPHATVSRHPRFPFLYFFNSSKIAVSNFYHSLEFVMGCQLDL